MRTLLMKKCHASVCLSHTPTVLIAVRPPVTCLHDVSLLSLLRDAKGLFLCVSHKHLHMLHLPSLCVCSVRKYTCLAPLRSHTCCLQAAKRWTCPCCCPPPYGSRAGDTTRRAMRWERERQETEVRAIEVGKSGSECEQERLRERHRCIRFA